MTRKTVRKFILDTFHLTGAPKITPRGSDIENLAVDSFDRCTRTGNFSVKLCRNEKIRFEPFFKHSNLHVDEIKYTK